LSADDDDVDETTTSTRLRRGTTRLDETTWRSF
jgi:hypothetical protein